MSKQESAKILEEFEGCTAENLGGLLPMMGKLGFKQVIAHRKISKVLPNSVYIFAMPGEGVKLDHQESVKHTITLPLYLTYVQEEFHPLSETPQGVLVFKSRNKEVIGFYNETGNVLYTSDLTHINGPRAGLPIKLMLKAIQKLKEKTTKKFMAWRRKWEKNIQYEVILMGADPEFEIVDDEGKIVNACTVFPDGCHADTKVGHDGLSHTGEMRPDPQDNPIKLTDEFEKLINEIATHPHFPGDGKMLVGGGKFHEIGGHIHVSGIDPESVLLDFLGVYIAEPMRKSMNADGLGSRRGQKAKSNWTRDNTDRARPADDGKDHWEWRVLMAYHFDRETSDAVHSVFYCLLETYRRNRKALVKTPKPADYKKLTYYDEYKKHIDKFIEKFVKGLQIMEGIDVLDRWVKTRSKDPKVSFVSCHRKEDTGTYDGLVPKEIAGIMDKLRGRQFNNLKRSYRCNVSYSTGGIILVSGIHKEALKKFKRSLLKKMVDISISEDLSRDSYNTFAWHFAFTLPKASYKVEENRKLLAECIGDSIQTTIDLADKPGKSPNVHQNESPTGDVDPEFVLEVN